MNHGVTKTGIIGDGQLALMLAEALSRKNASFLCYSASAESPMHTFYPEAVTSDAKRFVSECDVFTLENEFHTITELKELLGEKADKLFPDLDSYSPFANKISQRLFYEQAGITSPKWMSLLKPDDLIKLRIEFPFPFVLKASQGGYDGKGVRIIRSESELQDTLTAFRFFEGQPLLVEEKVTIVKEVAQGFLRDHDGRFTFLPLVDTIQEDGVCNLVQYPSTVNPNMQAQIEFFLEKLINTGLVGIFNFEFFIDQDNRVIINEGAPRTHNSQHLTIDASSASQFDLLASYLIGEKATPEKVSTSPSVMVNILGKRSGSYGALKLPDLSSVKTYSKLYGKTKSSPGRKLGHVNIVDEGGRADLLALGKKVLKEYDL